MNIFRSVQDRLVGRVYADAAAATPISRRARRELNRLLTLPGNAGALHGMGAPALPSISSR